MKPPFLIIDFSLLEPLAPTDQIPWFMFRSILIDNRQISLWKRLTIIGMIKRFIKRGRLNRVGRYRLRSENKSFRAIYALHFLDI